jgi:hypothetical protein
MNNFEIKYNKLTKYLIDKSFHILKQDNIVVIEDKNLPYRAMVISWPWKRQIIIGIKARRLSKQKLTGLLAHELCHLEMNKEKGFSWFLFMFIIWKLCKFSKICDKIIQKNEWNTDLLAIRKGYGKFIIQIKKNQIKKQKERYMPYQKVKEIMKQRN